MKRGKISPRRVADVLMEREKCQVNVMGTDRQLRMCGRAAVKKGDPAFLERWLCRKHAREEKRLLREAQHDAETEARVS